MPDRTGNPEPTDSPAADAERRQRGVFLMFFGVVTAVVFVSVLAACGSGDEGSQTPPSSSAVSEDAAVANPAAVFCEEQGGTVFGPEPMCGLPDGSAVDAWEYYRAETDGGEGPSTTTTPSAAVATTTSATTEPGAIVVSSTPVPTSAAATPLEVLAQLAASQGVIDYSGVSEGPCGSFAVLVEEDRVTFHESVGQAWVDQSEQLGPDGDARPLRVTTFDFTGDDVSEFLVEYERDDASGSYQFGSIFYPTYGEGLYGDGSWGCEWGWSYFRSDYDDFLSEPPYPQTLRYLRLEDGILRATEQQYKGETEAVVNFDSDKNIFEVEWPGPIASAEADTATPVCETYTYQEYEPFYLCTQGPSVEALQRALVFFGYLSGGADGYFGPGTDSAVRQLQLDYGVPEDGVVAGWWYREFIETYNLSR